MVSRRASACEGVPRATACRRTRAALAPRTAFAAARARRWTLAGILIRSHDEPSAAHGLSAELLDDFRGGGRGDLDDRMRITNIDLPDLGSRNAGVISDC